MVGFNIKKKLWKMGGLFALATVATTAITVFSYQISKMLVKIALDRQEPQFPQKSKDRLCGSSIETSLLQKLKQAAEHLRKENFETVKITTRDGVELIGHWYQAPNACRNILAMHGWRSSWSHDFGLISDFWHRNQCNVLYIEQRGQGASGGEWMGFGLMERHDCRDWIDWINQKDPRKLPLYLCGISMGASTVLMAAGEHLPENVCGIMADCGYTSPYAIWKHVIKNNLHLAFGTLSERFANDLCKKKIHMSPQEYSCVDAMRVCKIPVLFIHGTDDHFVPIEMTYENYKACRAPKQLFIVPGAEHGMSYLVDQDGYEQCMKRFWNETAPRVPFS